MSSGSQTVGDVVVSKFDMHVYTFVLTSDEVKTLVAEYAIPLNLHPCVPPFGLTMNRLLADKIDAMPWRHQDSSVADPSPTGIRAEDIRRLCENVIDLLPVHLAMLYAIGLTTIWKHVGYHPVFKDGERTGVRVGKGVALAANEVIPQHTTPHLPFGSQIPEISDHQKVVEYENKRVLAAKRKAQAAKDIAVGKRVATEGASQRPKKKKTTPLSFALSDSEADGSPRSGLGTHHSASPLNTIIPNEVELTTEGDGLISKLVNRAEEDADHHLDHVEDTTEVNSLLSEHSPCFQHSNPSDEDAYNARDETAHTHASGSTGRVSSSSGGSHRQAFPRRNPGGDDIGSSLRGDIGLSVPFVPAWNLTTYSILNGALQCSWFELGHGALAQIDILQRYEALNEDYEELYESHWSYHKALQQVQLGCVGKEADLTEKLVAVEKARDDLLDKDREREECIKQLLSSGEYKKSLTDIFNLAIAAGWSEGVKATCSEEEAETFLATVVDYDPTCKDTFMSEFNSLFNKSYPYVEKLVESFQLLLGDLQNMWSEGTGPTLSGNAAGA
ncbi:hypothetical protein Tco_0890903 [Tanacetum coccineum]|uniref:Uncharacterized protein n=1 Tax=Tanacetum coccineum TaxID=301880 RepID=A0ABQ5C1S5_9ASTR